MDENHNIRQLGAEEYNRKVVNLEFYVIRCKKTIR